MSNKRVQRGIFYQDKNEWVKVLNELDLFLSLRLTKPICTWNCCWKLNCCHSCCQETPTTKLEIFWRNIPGDDNIFKMSIHTIGLKYLAFVAIASIYWTQTSWLTLVISLISLGWLVHNITKSQKVEGAENWSAIISKLYIIFWHFDNDFNFNSQKCFPFFHLSWFWIFWYRCSNQTEGNWSEIHYSWKIWMFRWNLVW